MKVIDLIKELEIIVSASPAVAYYDLLAEPKIMGTRTTAPVSSLRYGQDEKDTNTLVIEYRDFGSVD